MQSKLTAGFYGTQVVVKSNVMVLQLSQWCQAC